MGAGSDRRLREAAVTAMKAKRTGERGNFSEPGHATSATGHQVGRIFHKVGRLRNSMPSTPK